MIEVGRVCYKLAGRDAGKPCVIIDVLDKKLVLIDGVVRRKKCNIKHLEFMPFVIDIKKKASTSDVLTAMIKSKIISELPKKGESRKPNPKPVKKKVVKEKLEKTKKKATKKVVNKKATKKVVNKKATKKVVNKKATKKVVNKKATKKKTTKKKAKKK